MFALIAAGVATAPASLVTPLVATIVDASLFKNGFAMVTRTMPIPRSGTYSLDPIPQASIGTLWFTASSGVNVSHILATSVPGKALKTDAQSLAHLLGLNVGRQVRVGIKNGDTVATGQANGKIVSVTPQILLLDDGKRTLAIPLASVTSVAAASGTLKTIVETSATRRALQFTVTGSGNLLMISLEQGVSWSPAYAIDISDDKELRLLAKATVINDLEDMPVLTAKLVTGFPNLPYAFTPDPLSSAPSGQQFQTLLQGVGGGAGGFGGAGRRELMFQNAASPAMDQVFNNPPPATGIAGSQEADLFFYKQPLPRLKRYDRASLTLFAARASYRQLFTWDVADAVENDTSYRGVDASVPQEFWRKLRFSNTAGQPLTSGVATTYRSGQLVGQDTLNYTPAGSEVELRISKALDLRAEFTEEEVSRARQQLQLPNRPYYDLVKLKGTLRIVNTKPEPVDIRVRKDLTGEVSVAEGGKITKPARGLRAINPRALIEWTRTLAGGETVTLSYEYSVYIQS